jgi:hypothetical protein
VALIQTLHKNTGLPPPSEAQLQQELRKHHHGNKVTQQDLVNFLPGFVGQVHREER